MSKAALHNHLESSFLDGRSRPEEAAQRAKDVGDVAVAVTDHDEVGGQIAFQKACDKIGIKAVHGTEARWLRNIEQSREDKTRGLDTSHTCLLAMNEEGLKNLWTLSSLAYEPENFYGKPQLDPNLMRRYSSGLWASDGCGITRFANFADNDDIDGCREEWSILLDIFGENFYSELHTFQIIDPLSPGDKDLNRKIRKMNQMKVMLAGEMGVPLVAVNDAHYAQEAEWEQHRLVWAMNTFKNDQTDEKGHAADWMMDGAEILHWLGQHGISQAVAQEAMDNSGLIAEMCNVEIKPTLSMPRLHDTDEDDTRAFQDSCEEGYRRFIAGKGLDSDVYRARLDREMALIVDKGMAGYFNIVGDYVMKARDGSYAKWINGGSQNKPCLCGPGRGSGGGSLVNYVLGITSIDPLKHDLSFERFINPDRPDYPDIDVDFQKSHRLDLIDYMGARYGSDKVVAIGTRSRSGPKKTLVDLCKVLGIPFKDANAMSKIIGKIDFQDFTADPDDLIDDEGNPVEPPSWEEVLSELGGELAPYMEKYRDTGLFKYVELMQGLSRQPGVHAAGIAVLPNPVLGLVPTRRKGGKGVMATQFDMNEIAWLGAVKDDFLSNKGLDVLAQARELIWQRHGKWIDYDGFGFGVPSDCKPEDVIVLGDEHQADQFIWQQIHNGHTAGIFQINTPSGTKQAMRFRPRNLQDLADLVAVNRPGVLRVKGLLQKYLDRRNGQAEITYDHPMMENITGRTMGILVYQEDLVECAKQLAGFTPGDGEYLRKGIGKKIKAILDELHPKFIEGCMANPAFTRHRAGTAKTAEKIWQSLEAAGAYAFNKAHSIGYATQAFWEIWTKAYYYDEFITSCLAVYPSDKTNIFIRECRRVGRPILPPDVNKSGSRFTLTDGIRYGLSDIKGIGEAAMPEILGKRPFGSLADYLTRTTKTAGWKRGIVDSLVKVGAFDWTGQSRSDLLDEVYYHWARMEIAQRKREKLSQEDTDAIVFDKWRNKPESYPRYHFEDPEVILKIENDLVGTFITHDPMGKYIPMIEGECIKHPMDMEDFESGQRFVIGGELTRIKTHMQRNNQQMAFLTVRYNEEDFEFLAFADAWKSCKTFLKEGAPVACEVIKLSGDGANLSTAIRLDWI